MTLAGFALIFAVCLAVDWVWEQPNRRDLTRRIAIVVVVLLAYMFIA